jgi:GntR family transcriptional repressor for pyruvate dehydrogenase complex
MATDYELLIEPVKSKRTFEEVSEKLKDLIFSGTLKPGQQLPSEPALAQLFHVGRQSVREALRVLELSGFITVRPGVKGGAIIQSTMLSKLANLFSETIKLHKVSPEDCMAARRAIETSLLDLVFENAGREDIEALRSNIMAARRKLHTDRSAYEENIDYHRLLAKASKNHTFTIVMESILSVFCELKSRHAGVQLKESRAITDLHEAITDALATKQRSTAAELLREDLLTAEGIMRRSGAPPSTAVGIAEQEKTTPIRPAKQKIHKTGLKHKRR